jgi:hypothetical protein
VSDKATKSKLVIEMTCDGTVLRPDTQDAWLRSTVGRIKSVTDKHKEHAAGSVSVSLLDLENYDKFKEGQKYRITIERIA